MSDTARRVLMLATYFPKPLNRLMGNWALAQAQALQRNGLNVKVVSLTSWVPSLLAVTKGARAYAACPARYEWEEVGALYPRWLYYQVGAARFLNGRYPALTGRLGWLTAKSKLLETVREFRPQLIYAHHTAVNGFLAAKLKARTGLPFAVTDHDFGEIECCRWWPRRRELFREVARGSSAMISVSRRMEREVKHQLPFARTCTIHNGAEPISREVLERLRPPELRDKLIVFSCGTFYHRKGFPLLIDAFARVARRLQKVELRIIGDGAERNRLERRIAAHGLETRIALLGARSHAEVIQEMAWCDVFALIGWDEPFATVYLEALSAGKPVVCCSDGGITDVVKNGEHGFTVPPRDIAAAANALEVLLVNRELRCRLGRSALQLFHTSLTWDRHAQRMKEIFTVMVEKGLHVSP